MWGLLVVVFTALISSPSAASQDSDYSYTLDSSASSKSRLNKEIWSPSAESALFYGPSGSTEGGQKVTKDQHATAVYDFNASRYIENPLYFKDTEYAEVEASEDKVDSAQLHTSTSFVVEREEPKQSVGDLNCLTNTAIAPSTFHSLQKNPVDCPKIDLEFSAPSALEPAFAVEVGPAQTFPDHQRTTPATAHANTYFTQINYKELPSDLLYLLVCKIGERLSRAEKFERGGNVSRTLCYAINLFEEILKRLEPQFADGGEWITNNVKINKEYIESAIRRIQNNRNGNLIKTTDIIFLTNIVCGVNLTHSADRIRQVAIHIYAHAVTLLGDIDGTCISEEGLLFLDGRYFPLHAEVLEFSRREHANKKNERQKMSTPYEDNYYIIG